MSSFSTTSSETQSSNFLAKLKKSAEENNHNPVPGSTTVVQASIYPRLETSCTSTPTMDLSIPTKDGNASITYSSIRNVPPYRMTQFEKLLNSDSVDLNSLRNISWNGIPTGFRPDIWKMLLGYLPLKKDRREDALRRKRGEYLECIPIYFKVSDLDRSTLEGETHRQIIVDLPRTCPDNPFFHQQSVRKAMERILYIWAIRHPASGYVQGMNDILTPILLVCAQGFVGDPQRCDFGSVDVNTMNNLEADSYWCFTKLMDNIQDHYTFSQPGLQRMILRLEDLIHRIDKELFDHLEQEGMQYIQFGFRWMNCVLIREFSLRSIIRIWDTYLSEETGGFENFHVYVCAVILKTFRDKLIGLSFQDMFMFLQDLPTAEWSEEDVEPILSQAYILKSLFENSPSHLGY